MKKSLLFYIIFWIFILGSLLLTPSSCWFNHHTEDSFSEVITVIFLIFAFINLFKFKNYLLLGFILFFILEEINYGQIFLNYSWEELNVDEIQWAIHTKGTSYLPSWLNTYFIFNIVFLTYLTYTFKNNLNYITTIFSLFIIINFIEYLPIIWCLDGTKTEPIELFYGSTFWLLSLFKLESKP